MKPTSGHNAARTRPAPDRSDPWVSIPGWVDIYARPWLGVGDEITFLDGLARSGAIAAVGVLDLPADAAHGAYYPYDGKIRAVPGLYVDRDTGGHLKDAAAGGARAQLVLPAEVKRVTSRNLIGVIPGASDELMLLHCHTDGTNGVEDNGPNAIIAISQYLARLPRGALPRTIMVLLTTGHFHGAVGTAEFVRRHRNGLLRRVAGAITIEHLGTREWEPGSDGRYQLTGGYEPGTFFAPESSPLVDASYAALRRATAAPASVLHPYVAAPGSPDGNGWPAEGTDLWTMGGAHGQLHHRPLLPAELGHPDNGQARHCAHAPRSDLVYPNAP